MSKLKEIGTFKWGDNENSEWKNTEEAEFLEIKDYYNAINKGIAENKDEEIFIRHQIWWAYNDRVREGQEIFSDENDELRWVENIKKLKELLDQSGINQKIMIAEINRNLGDFENCISIVQSIDNNEVKWIKEKFINECQRKNRWVVVLK